MSEFIGTEFVKKGISMKGTIIFDIKAHDDYMLNVKIDYPYRAKSVVIFCHGSGANTYDNHRVINDKEFNYFDLFADEFCQRDIAFCRWNTRGCQPSDNPPDFVSIREKDFQTYCPSTSIKDIVTVTNFVKAMPQFRNTDIIFMGISEGATLIPFAAAQYKDVTGLLLLGFSYENMKDTLDFQLSGGSSMVNMCKWFDCSDKGFIDKSDFELDKYQVRPAVFPDTDFEELDIDKDGKITKNDFALQLATYKAEVFNAIENDNDDWLRNNYSVHITSKWCKEHFALPSVSTVLCSLSMPIYVFQGENDANIPSSDIAKIRYDFERAGKDNLNIFTFQNHDHDLNYLQFPFYGKISEGLLCVFDMAQNIK